VILDRELPLELAPAFGCGVSTGAGAVLNVMDLRPGSRLAILGTGTVGLAALMSGAGSIGPGARRSPDGIRYPGSRSAGM
jgi:Zn-dependent alcohol dehydrogenase